MFEFNETSGAATGSKRKQPPPWGKLWFTFFTATFAGVLLAGLVLGLGVRTYLKWSVSDTAEQIKQRNEERKK